MIIGKNAVANMYTHTYCLLHLYNFKMYHKILEIYMACIFTNDQNEKQYGKFTLPVIFH